MYYKTHNCILIYVVRKISIKYGNRLCSIRLLAVQVWVWYYYYCYRKQNRNRKSFAICDHHARCLSMCDEHYYNIVSTSTYTEISYTNYIRTYYFIKTALTIRNIVDEKKVFTYKYFGRAYIILYLYRRHVITLMELMIWWELILEHFKWNSFIHCADIYYIIIMHLRFLWAVCFFSFLYKLCILPRSVHLIFLIYNNFHIFSRHIVCTLCYIDEQRHNVFARSLMRTTTFARDYRYKF